MKIKAGSMGETVWGLSRIMIGFLPIVLIVFFFNPMYFFIYLVLGVIVSFFINAKLKTEAAKFNILVFIFKVVSWPVGLLLLDDLYKMKKRSAFGREISKAIDKRIEMDEQIERMSESGTDQDVIPWGIGEFGLEVTNPIPVNGRSGRMSYMEKIRPLNTSDFAWEEELPGSVRAPNIKHPIDKYVILIEGEKFVPIYLSIYHKKTSDKAPKGFKLVDLERRQGTCVRWVDS